MKRNALSCTLSLTVGLGLLAMRPAAAAVFTWDGDSGSNWSTGNNWTGGNPPPNNGTADPAFINAGGASTAATADAAWSVNSLTFNTSLAAGGFTLSGSALTLNGGTDLTVSNADGQKPVTIANALVLTARSDVSLVKATSGGRVVTTLNGNISGAGALRVTAGNSGALNEVPELVLGGLNSWTGSYFGNSFNTGPGGLMGGNAANGMNLIRFSNPSALPTGNGGNTAYLAAMRNGQSSNFEPFGFLFTGGVTEQVYDPAASLKIMIGGDLSSYPGRGLLGSTGGLARLEGAEVIVFVGTTSTRILGLALRVLDGTLTLGSSGKPVTFQSAYGVADTDNGLAGAASSVGIDILDTTTAQTLYKVGTGTLKLGNVSYTELNGSTDKTSKFQWSVVEGAVRGLSNTDPARNLSNSLFPASGSVTPFSAVPVFADGVYEIDNSSGDSGMFTAKLNRSGADEISLKASTTTGGGFASFGNPVTVSLDTDKANDEIMFNWYTHPATMMVFGSRTANAKLTMTNPIDLGTSSLQREFRVIDNPYSTADLTEFSGVIRNTSGGAGGINKTGDGTLILSRANTYAGSTSVTGGTLRVSNATGSATGPGLVTVYSGASISGTGSVANLTLSGGALKPYDLGGGVPSKLNVTNTLDITTGALDLSGVGTIAPGHHVLVEYPALVGDSFATVIGRPNTHTLQYGATAIILKNSPAGTGFTFR